MAKKSAAYGEGADRQLFSGWRRQAPDYRDFRYTITQRDLAVLPATADLSAFMPPQLDQGSLGICGPNSADECIEYDERVQNYPVSSASRLFIYWNTRFLMNEVDTDSGVDNRTMLKALNKYGFCSESMWPYNVAKFKVKPDPQCFQAAMPYRIKSYAAVAKNLDQMRGCIANGFPFIYGFDVYSSMMTAKVAKTGIVPMPSAAEKQRGPIGGHDVTIFGYDDHKKLFKFRNHWLNANGTPWGDHGNGYMHYDYAVSSMASDFWVINAVPAPAHAASPASPVGAGFSGTLTYKDGLLISATPAQ